MTPLIVAQITDCHLQNDPEQRYRDVDVERNLSHVVDDINVLRQPAELLLWTGDLIHHGALPGYTRLKQRLSLLPQSSYWIPGNHDNADLMDEVGGDANQRTIIRNSWAIIMLDSCSEPDGRGGGCLSSEELNFLEQQLRQYHDLHCLIALHHNPLPVESAWQDQIMLANARSFWEHLAPHGNVRGVINGHVHQQWDLYHQGVRVMMTPASSVQFKATCEQMVLEDDSELKFPGYRLLQLYPDGRIETSVKRVVG